MAKLTGAQHNLLAAAAFGRLAADGYESAFNRMARRLAKAGLLSITTGRRSGESFEITEAGRKALEALDGT